MLIGLNFDKTTESDTKEQIAVSIGKQIKGDVRVLESRSIEEYYDVLRTYRPTSKKSLVLVNTHLNLIDRSLTANMRRTDVEFSRRGGVIFGIDPEISTITYQNKILTDRLDHIVASAEYAQTRASSVSKTASRYVGRTDSDPHTLILGYTPSWPKLDAASAALYSVLRDDWWPGLGFFQPKGKSGDLAVEAYKTLVERFMFASLVCVTDTAADLLDRAGLEYQRAQPLRATTLPEARRYSNTLRELARLDSLRVVE